MPAAPHVSYRLDGPLPPEVCAKVGRMLSLSANSLGRKMRCSAAQAEALQLYLLGTLVCAYRRAQGQDEGPLVRRMQSVFRQLSEPMRREIRETM